MSAPKIEKVSFDGNYGISICLKDGQHVFYDMKPKLVTARFRDLADKNVFRKGTVAESGRMIKWNACTEITAEEILRQTISGKQPDFNGELRDEKEKRQGKETKE